METTQPATNQSSASLPIRGLVCLLLAGMLFLGAASFLGVLVLIDAALPKMVFLVGLVQIVVSILFALAGLLYLRKSRHAKVLLCISIACLLIELPIAAFAGFTALTS